MENAAKGLIMAGGILIAVIVLSLGVYIFTTFSEGTEPYNKTFTEQEIWAFNNKFLDCIDNNNQATIQDVVTMINLALSTENEEIPVRVIFKSNAYGCKMDGTVEGKGVNLVDKLENEITEAVKPKYSITNIEYYTVDDPNPYIIGAIKQITIN